MKRIHMRETRETRWGLLRAGKPYSVPEDLANELIGDDAAFDLDKPQPERAVAGAEENAARVSKQPRKRTRRKKAASDE